LKYEPFNPYRGSEPLPCQLCRENPSQTEHVACNDVYNCGGLEGTDHVSTGEGEKLGRTELQACSRRPEEASTGRALALTCMVCVLVHSLSRGNFHHNITQQTKQDGPPNLGSTLLIRHTRLFATAIRLIQIDSAFQLTDLARPISANDCCCLHFDFGTHWIGRVRAMKGLWAEPLRKPLCSQRLFLAWASASGKFDGLSFESNCGP
jgi:hypothetical protein